MDEKMEMYQSQLNNFNESLDRIRDSYAELVAKRILTDELSKPENRDRYMVYEMMDMMIPLQAILSEVTSSYIDPGYLMEKLNKIKSYVDMTINYFK